MYRTKRIYGMPKTHAHKQIPSGLKGFESETPELDRKS